MEYLDIWASSIIFFLSASFFGTTVQSLNHKVPSKSSRKQLTFGSPSNNLLLGCAIPSSFFCVSMISSLNRGVSMMLCSDKSVSLVTQHVHNYICLAWMIVNFQLVVLDQLKQSSLPHVQVQLREDVLQAHVVYVDVSHITKQVMSPYYQC
jgi:hypothetical protein